MQEGLTLFQQCKYFEQTDFNFSRTAPALHATEFDPFPGKIGKWAEQEDECFRQTILVLKGLEMLAESLHFVAAFYKGT